MTPGEALEASTSVARDPDRAIQKRIWGRLIGFNPVARIVS